MAAFLEELERLVEAMNEAAEGPMLELTPPPSFALAVTGDEARLTITTDNGGGMETSHPIEHVVRIAIDGDSVTLRADGASHSLSPEMALAWLRERCSAELPSGT